MGLENQVDNMNKLQSIPKIVVSIKTNYLQNHKFAFCQNTSVNKKILLALYKEGLISGFKEEEKLIRIKLKYYRDKSLLGNIKTIYKPSLKLSFKFNSIQSYRSMFDIFFISTASGIISSNDMLKLKAFGKKTGGQLLIGIDLINDIG